MIIQKAFAAIMTLVVLAGAASAEAELHIVGVYEGSERTGDEIHGPRVLVNVDRPGAQVTLLLISYDATRWIVEASAETAINRIVLSGHHSVESEVVFNGADMQHELLQQGPTSVYQAEGSPFQGLLNWIPTVFNVDAPDSFQGAYRPDEAFDITPDTEPLPQFAPDFLDQFVDRGVLTERLASILDIPHEGPPYRFTQNGFEITAASGEVKVFDPGLDVPRISHATGAAHDPEADIYYGVSLGGEGFLYRFDLATLEWSVLQSMDNFDANGLIHDPVGNRLVATGAHFLGSPTIEIIALGDGPDQSIQISPDDMPGARDLFDAGNGPGPSVAPLGVDGDQLLVALGPYNRRWGGPHSGPARYYVIDLARGDATLVRWVD